MVITETEVAGRRVLVLDPPVLPPSAPVLVGLHGLGTNAEDFMDLAEALELEGCRFVLPDAPLSLPGYPPGAYAWYDFETHERGGIEASRDHLFKVFDRFVKDPNVRRLDGKPRTEPLLAVFGFSQGGMMALEAGLNHQGRVAGIASMSGYIPDPSKTLSKCRAPKDVPILLVHGTYDPVVPIEGSRRAVEALKGEGYSPEFREFPMEHSVTMESLGMVGDFLRRSIG